MIFFIKLVQFDRLIIDISEVLQNYRNIIGKSWQDTILLNCFAGLYITKMD